MASFWHIDQMNWSSNIWVAHIWVLAYIVEPLTLPLTEPGGDQAKAPLPEDLREGPVFEGLRRVLLVGFVVGVSVGLLLFLNPEFMDTRWPWPLDPSDARIMGAFPILAGVWALHGYPGTDSAEIKSGVLGAILLTTGFFAVWLYNPRARAYPNLLRRGRARCRHHSERLTACVKHSQEQGAAQATIQQECAQMRRAFNLALRAGRLPFVPPFPRLRVDNARRSSSMARRCVRQADSGGFDRRSAARCSRSRRDWGHHRTRPACHAFA